jgi:hypothetical protein
VPWAACPPSPHGGAFQVLHEFAEGHPASHFQPTLGQNGHRRQQASRGWIGRKSEPTRR